MKIEINYNCRKLFEFYQGEIIYHKEIHLKQIDIEF